MPYTTDMYVGLITSHHQSKPKFNTTVEFSVAPYVQLLNTLDTVTEAYSLDTAVGAQLDVVGQWVGITRSLSEPLQNIYFSWGTATLGWGSGRWKGPYDPTTGIILLDDDTYRILLRAKIAANYWNGTLPGAKAVFSTGLFRTPGALPFVVDNKNMTMSFGVSQQKLNAVEWAILINGLIPLVPSTVSVQGYYEVSVPGTPLFGWGNENDLISGWGVGSWGITQNQNPSTGQRIVAPIALWDTVGVGWDVGGWAGDTTI